MLRSIISRIKERIPFLVLLAVFWAAAASMHPVGSAQVAESLSTGRTGSTEIVHADESLSLSFRCNQANLQGIRIYFSGSETSKDAVFEIKVKDAAGQSVFQDELKRTDLSDDGSFVISFPEIADADGQSYTVVVQNCSEKGAVGILAAAPSARDDEVSINGKVSDNSINYQIIYRHERWPVVLKLVLIILILLSFLLVLLLGNDPAGNFLMLAAFSAFIIILNPMPHPIDEPTHMSKAFDISEGRLVYDLIDGQSGVYLPENYHDFMAGYRNRLDLKSMVTDPEALSKPFSDENVFEATEFMNSYPFFAYIPSAIGIALFRGLHAPGILVLLAGRIFNYIVYVLLAYLAIRKAKYYRGIVFGVLLLPMILSVAGSVHSDMLLDVCSVLMVALALQYRFAPETEHMSKRDMAVMLLCVIGVATSKYLIYTPVLLFFFLIPREKFTTKKQWTILLAAALILTAALACFQFALMRIYPYTETRVEGVDVGGQIKFILANKKYAAELIFLHVVRRLREFMVLSDMTTFQTAFSSVAFFVPASVWIAAILAPDKMPFHRKRESFLLKLLIPLFAVMICMLITCSLYLGFTPVGYNSVMGVQPRYIYPIILPCMLAVSMCFPNAKGSKNYFRNLSCVMLLGVVHMLFSAVISM